MLLAAVVALMLSTGCSGNEGGTAASTLMLQVREQPGGSWAVQGYSYRDDPYHSGSGNAPLFQADLLDRQGKILTSVYFEKAFFGGDSLHTLPFPALPELARIVIYRLDSSSGHITNRNHDTVLSWAVPVDTTQASAG
jgi:hypothetical protein